MPRPGRRGADADTRTDLLSAGAALLERGGTELPSMRAVAERAKANPAMVRYFFGDRLGYLRALLDDGFEQVLADVPDGASFPCTVSALFGALPQVLGL